MRITTCEHGEGEKEQVHESTPANYLLQTSLRTLVHHDHGGSTTSCRRRRIRARVCTNAASTTTIFIHSVPEATNCTLQRCERHWRNRAPQIHTEKPVPHVPERSHEATLALGSILPNAAAGHLFLALARGAASQVVLALI